MRISNRRWSFALLSVLTPTLLASSCSQSQPPPADYSVDAGTPPAPISLALPEGPAVPDPSTCEAAAAAHSYVGCDYWPTVMANTVWSYFDYAVVVSNVGATPATVTVTGPNATRQVVTIGPGAVEKMVLPWVPALKGVDTYDLGALPASILARASAYHLVSSVPVVAYQFNALEYQRPYSGPVTAVNEGSCDFDAGTCFSFTNDASLLLPSTAWTSSYRVTGISGEPSPSAQQQGNGSYVVVVASQPGTTVRVALAAAGAVLAGIGIAAAPGGGSMTVTLDAGDVVELASPVGSAYDLSGSLVTSDKPVEVFAGNPIRCIPAGATACDHIEELVMPAESLGRDYIVTVPTRPAGGLGAHVVRVYGNRDGTTLTYAPKKPHGCPDSLNAGDVVDCGMITDDFIVQGTNEFAIASFTASAQIYGPFERRGDPDQTIYAAALQFRTRYVFLAPTDYDVSYAVVSGASDAAPVLDGVPLADYREVSSGYGVWRPTLDRATGAHTLTSARPVGLQVMGYGAYTSYTYPGGLSVVAISPPPSPVK